MFCWNRNDISKCWRLKNQTESRHDRPEMRWFNGRYWDTPGQGLLSNEFRDDLDIFSMFEKPKTREVLGWAPSDTASLGTKIKWDFYCCFKFAVSKLLFYNGSFSIESWKSFYGQNYGLNFFQWFKNLPYHPTIWDEKKMFRINWMLFYNITDFKRSQRRYSNTNLNFFRWRWPHRA